MKSSNEMIDSLLMRREIYEAEKERKRKQIMGAIAPICSLFLVALMGIGIWKSGVLMGGPAITPDTSVSNGGEDVQLDTKAPSVSADIENNGGEDKGSSDTVNTDRVIVINSIDKLPEKVMEINIKLNELEKMQEDEISAYYGTSVFPSVPEDLVLQPAAYGIYKRADSGEVYYDKITINYKSKAEDRWVCVVVAKDKLPFFDQGFGTDKEISIINGEEIVIAKDPNGILFAAFIFSNTGFSVSSQGLTEEEFVSAVESLIK